MWKHQQKYVFFALLTGGSACAGSHAEQVQDARMKKAEETAQARTDAVDKQADQSQETVDESYDSRRKAVKDSEFPGSDQSAKLTDLAKERAEYQTETQTKLDKIAVHIQEAQQQVNVLAARAPTQLRTDVQTAADEHRMLQQDLSSLSRATSQSWEPNKKRLDQRVSQLQDRVSKLSNEVDDARG